MLRSLLLCQHFHLRALAARYLDVIENKNQGYLKLADSTGLGSFSFDELVAKVFDSELLSAGPGAVLQENERGLAELIDTLQWLPELNLSFEIAKGPLNVECIAQMTHEWMSGAPLDLISQHYPEQNPEKQLRDAGRYVFSTLSQMLAWGAHAYIKALNMNEEFTAQDRDLMLPAYLQYGVNTPEAVVASILGVPRQISLAVSEVFKSIHGDLEPENVREFRELIESDNSAFWGAVKDHTGFGDDISTQNVIDLVQDIQGA